MAEPSYPAELLYHSEHDWARVDGDEATFGITWYAQDSLGEVVFFEAPDAGATVTKDEPYAEVESVKAVSDVIAPLSGEVVAVNEALSDSPETVNDDPYGEGWLVRVKLSDPVGGRAAAGCRGVRGEPAMRASYHDPLHLATDADRAAMLDAIGVGSVEELFEDIPPSLRLGRPLALDAGLCEQEVYDELRGARRAQRLDRGRDRRSSAPACTTTTSPRWSTRSSSAPSS